MAKDWMTEKLQGFADGKPRLSKTNQGRLEALGAAKDRVVRNVRRVVDPRVAAAKEKYNNVRTNVTARGQSLRDKLPTPEQAGTNVRNAARTATSVDTWREVGEKARANIPDPVRNQWKRVDDSVRRAAGGVANVAKSAEEAARLEARRIKREGRVNALLNERPAEEKPSLRSDDARAHGQSRAGEQKGRVTRAKEAVGKVFSRKRDGAAVVDTAEKVAKGGAARTIGKFALRTVPFVGSGLGLYEGSKDPSSNERMGERITGMGQGGQSTGWQLAANRAIGGFANAVNPLAGLVDSEAGYDPNNDWEGSSGGPRTPPKPAQTPAPEPAIVASTAGGIRAPVAEDLFARTAAETGAPLSIDNDGKPIFNDVGNVIGEDARGRKIIQDSPNEFRGGLRATRGNRGPDIDPETALQNSLASIERQRQSLRDDYLQKEADSMGISVDRLRTRRTAEQISDLTRAGLTNNALYEYVRQGGLDGGGGGYVDPANAIKYAELQRKVANDNRNYGLRSQEVGLRAQGLDLQARGLESTDAYRRGSLRQRGDEFAYRQEEDRYQRGQDAFDNEMTVHNARVNLQSTLNEMDDASYERFTTVVNMLSDPNTEAMGTAMAQQMMNESGPGPSALVNFFVSRGYDTGYIDSILNLGRSAPRPMNDQDLRSNYHVDGTMYPELKRNDNQVVGLDLDDAANRVLLERLSAQGIR
jgi:hypothetical protein